MTNNRHKLSVRSARFTLPTEEEIMTFAPGDVVTLRSGGHSMTVVSVSEDDIECMWLGDDGELYRQSIPAIALRILESIEINEEYDAEEDEPEEEDEEDEEGGEEDDEEEEEDEDDEDDDEDDEEETEKEEGRERRHAR
jgi:uncharacterized protein YodC (DUF2158 family)